MQSNACPLVPYIPTNPNNGESSKRQSLGSDRPHRLLENVTIPFLEGYVVKGHRINMTVNESNPLYL